MNIDTRLMRVNERARKTKAYQESSSGKYLCSPWFDQIKFETNNMAATETMPMDTPHAMRPSKPLRGKHLGDVMARQRNKIIW